jgi:hypothetical protein
MSNDQMELFELVSKSGVTKIPDDISQVIADYSKDLFNVGDVIDCLIPVCTHIWQFAEVLDFSSDGSKLKIRSSTQREPQEEWIDVAEAHVSRIYKKDSEVSIDAIQVGDKVDWRSKFGHIHECVVLGITETHFHLEAVEVSCYSCSPCRGNGLVFKEVDQIRRVPEDVRHMLRDRKKRRTSNT